MKILAIDTSGPVAGCALLKDGKIVHAVTMNHGLTHSETILPELDATLAYAGLTPKDVDCVAAVTGPGSFTGVRIGVCAAKGLAHAAEKPCFEANALEVLAMNAPGFPGVVCSILDARRDQVYCAAFRMDGQFPVRLLPDRAMALKDFLNDLPEGEPLLFVGDGVLPHEEELKACEGRNCIPAHPALRDIRPENACVLAEMRKDEWKRPHDIKPYYLRAPQAERERAARLKEK